MAAQDILQIQATESAAYAVDPNVSRIALDFDQNLVRRSFQDGADLVLEMKDGQFIRLSGYYNAAAGTVALEYGTLIEVAAASTGAMGPIVAGLGVAGGAAALGAAGGSDDNDTPPAPPEDSAAVNSTINLSDGLVTTSGTTDPDAVVTVTFPDATAQTVTADAGGAFSVTSAARQPAGDVVTTTLNDDGLTSTQIDKEAIADTFPPAAVTITSSNVGADGNLTVSGSGEAGATVTVTMPDGSTVTALVAVDGTFAATSASAQAASTAGSPSAIPTAPAVHDIVTANTDLLNGLGVPGTVIEVRDVGNAALGSATVNGAGNWFMTTNRVLIDGETVTAVQTNADTSTTTSGAVALKVQANSIQNGDFVNSDANWGYSGGTQTITDGVYTVEIGGNRALHFSGGGRPSGGTATQSFATTIGATYDMSVDVWHWLINSHTDRTQDIEIRVLAADNSALVSYDDTLAFDYTPSTETFTFVATSTTTTLSIANPASFDSLDSNLVVDDISIVERIIDSDGDNLVDSFDTNEVFATQVDAVGIAQTDDATIALSEDTAAPPTPTISQYVGEDGLLLNGTGEPRNTVEVFDSSAASLGTALVGDDGYWSLIPTSAVNPGDTITATVSDGAGKTSGAASLTRGFGLLVNADFEGSNAGAWTLSDLGGSSGPDGQLPLFFDPAAPPLTKHLLFNNNTDEGGDTASQAFTTEVGKTYDLTSVVRDFGGANVTHDATIEILDSANAVIATTGSFSSVFGSAQTIDLNFTATTTSTTVRITNTNVGGAGSDLGFDYVAIQEVYGDADNDDILDPFDPDLPATASFAALSEPLDFSVLDALTDTQLDQTAVTPQAMTLNARDLLDLPGDSGNVPLPGDAEDALNSAGVESAASMAMAMAADILDVYALDDTTIFLHEDTSIIHT